MNPKTRYIFIFIVILYIAPIQPGTAYAQNVRKFDPPVVKIELSSQEPLPPGVAAETAFGGGAGGATWQDVVSPQNAGPYWYHLPERITYPSSAIPGAMGLLACGYSSTERPRGIFTSPDSHTEEASGQLWDSNALGSTFASRCWWYELEENSGMELGQYSLVLDHPEGTLNYTWEFDYPDCAVERAFHTSSAGEMFAGEEKTLLMGFPANKTLSVRFYSTLTPDSSTIRYLASRDVQTDGNGAVVLDISVPRSAAFWGEDIDVGVDGYDKRYIDPFEARFSPYGQHANCSGKAPSAQRPSSPNEAHRYSSIWANLNFKDMTAPGIQTYETTVDPWQPSSFSFTWCADNKERLQKILAPLTVSFWINDTEIKDTSILSFNDRSCHKWATTLMGWQYKTTVILEIRYSLSEAIFDGSTTYQAGNYTQRIVVKLD